MQNKSDNRAKFQPVDYDNRDFDKDKLDALQYNMLRPSKSKIENGGGNKRYSESNKNV